VAVIIPTFRRPESLARALRSVFAQDRADLIAEIAVVDNSNEGSARAAVEALRPLSPAPLIYIHAAPPGVATARNAGVAATAAPYVAFLDDDEVAHKGWLGALYDIHQRYQADVTFGPVQGQTPDVPAWKRPYLERFFSRTGPPTSGPSQEVHGCGNSMMTRATALSGEKPFDVRADDTGGEDDRLFSDLRVRGARFAWAAEAVVDEHAPANRATISYALSRAIAYGQSPSELCRRRREWLGVAKWMVIGAGQAVVYSTAALGLMLLKRPVWISALDQAARGLGKVVWFHKFHFYGQGAARFVSAAGPEAVGPEAAGAASFAAMATKITQIKSL
jgi:succinoglycan biosynthesis protein ExoM